MDSVLVFTAAGAGLEQHLPDGDRAAEKEEGTRQDHRRATKHPGLLPRLWLSIPAPAPRGTGQQGPGLGDTRPGGGRERGEAPPSPGRQELRHVGGTVRNGLDLTSQQKGVRPLTREGQQGRYLESALKRGHHPDFTFRTVT